MPPDDPPPAPASARRDRPTAEVLLHRYNQIFAVVVLAVAPFFPTDGIGIDLCWFKNLTGLPCPGCGLTRSIACLAHLEFAKSLRYHPFGPVFFAGCVFLTLLLVSGAATRERIYGWLVVYDRPARWIYLGIVYSFIAFGLARLALVLIGSGTLHPV